MKLRNAFHLLIDNFSNVYKLLLYRIVVDILAFSVGYVILSFGLRSILSGSETREIVSLLGEFFRAIASGDVEYLQGFQELFNEALKSFLNLIGSNIGSIVGSVAGLCIVYLAARFINGLATFTVGCAVNDRMRLYARTKFSSAFFGNLSRACLYTLAYVPLVFVYDVISVLICWFFFFYALSFLPLLITIPLVFTALACLQALKFTLTSAWMPSVVTNGDGIGKAFKASLKNGKGFGGRFSSYLVCMYLIVIGNVLCAVCTLGSGLLLTVPTCYLILICLQYVYYYEDNGRKYFISIDKIAGADSLQ